MKIVLSFHIELTCKIQCHKFRSFEHILSNIRTEASLQSGPNTFIWKLIETSISFQYVNNTVTEWRLHIANKYALDYTFGAHS